MFRSYGVTVSLFDWPSASHFDGDIHSMVGYLDVRYASATTPLNEHLHDDDDDAVEDGDGVDLMC